MQQCPPRGPEKQSKGSGEGGVNMRQRGEGTQAEKVEDPALIPAGREISKG